MDKATKSIKELLILNYCRGVIMYNKLENHEKLEVDKLVQNVNDLHLLDPKRRVIANDILQIFMRH